MRQVSRESEASIQDIAASAEEKWASMEEITSPFVTLANMAEELKELTSQFKSMKKYPGINWVFF